MARIRTLIMGAAGRDFHNFNTFFRGNEDYEVLAFTATQIPNIDGRKYPAALAGELYPDGVPIYPEEDLLDLIEKENKRLEALIEPDLMEHHHYVIEIREENTKLKEALEYCIYALERAILFKPHSVSQREEEQKALDQAKQVLEETDER